METSIHVTDYQKSIKCEISDLTTGANPLKDTYCLKLIFGTWVDRHLFFMNERQLIEFKNQVLWTVEKQLKTLNERRNNAKA